MKALRLMLAVIPMAALTGSLSAEITRNTPDAPIKSVTVYQRSALITRVATMGLPKGDHAITIDSLPARLDDASIRASAEGVPGITILGLTYKLEHHTESPQKKIADLEAEIRTLENDHKKALTDRLDVLAKQQELIQGLITSSGSVSGDQLARAGLDITQWDAAFEFVGRRLGQIRDSMRILTDQLRTADKQLNSLKARLQGVRGTRARASKSVQVDIRLANEGSVELALEYLVSGANWIPLYDARLAGERDKVGFTCYAEVCQSTGEDWNDVDLTLSTASPNAGTGPGEFLPKYLSLAEPKNITPIGDPTIVSVAMEPKVTELNEKITVRGRPDILDKFEVAGQVNITPGEVRRRSRRPRRKAALPGTAVIRGMSGHTTAYWIERKESIPSGGDFVRVPVAQWILNGETKLVSRPQNREGAFRLVTVTNQDETPLMPGVVSIFAQSDYLGRVGLSKLVAPNESFVLPFGLDNTVSVKREILSHKKSERGDKWRVEQTVKITLENHSNGEKILELEESLPLSQDNRVKIKLEEITPEPTSQDEKGKATWSMTLAPGEKTEVLIPYRIEYPKSVRVVGF
ncbi:MAG: mucoidy inhibitor MuiA family protein [Candidatus Zixiibacteriota bacterium]|nr:MAG: mucoidy inhibitor MuiA family protein [candidate division Zixibacteria bacterium]